MGALHHQQLRWCFRNLCGREEVKAKTRYLCERSLWICRSWAKPCGTVGEWGRKPNNSGPTTGCNQVLVCRRICADSSLWNKLLSLPYWFLSVAGDTCSSALCFMLCLCYAEICLFIIQRWRCKMKLPNTHVLNHLVTLCVCGVLHGLFGFSYLLFSSSTFSNYPG